MMNMIDDVMSMVGVGGYSTYYHYHAEPLLSSFPSHRDTWADDFRIVYVGKGADRVP